MLTNTPFDLLTIDPKRIIERYMSAYAIMDGFPVSDGHCLILHKRLTNSWFDLTVNEQNEILTLLHLVKEKIDKKFKPNGYNIGFNLGKAAGQTVDHFHIHVIPRYTGDVTNPVGGIRNVIPAKGNYL